MPANRAAASLAALPLARARGREGGQCRDRFEAPAQGSRAVDLNGVRLPDVCINGTGPTGAYEVFVIGDWGGHRVHGHAAVTAADHRKSGVHKRDFVTGLDDFPQQRVAAAMGKRAMWVDPDYVINVGDNFYPVACDRPATPRQRSLRSQPAGGPRCRWHVAGWAGVDQECCTTHGENNFSSQWDDIFEAMYTGTGLDGKQWLGVLGNHDYGGFMFTSAWDQAIKYTWRHSVGNLGRWMTPALFWSTTVRYPDFSVDYFFMDSNIFDAEDPYTDIHHNICSIAHNAINATCEAEGGPESTTDCPGWFQRLWDEQSEWLEWQLSASDTTWQIVVTHFPPSFGESFWKHVSAKYGIDLIITGHLHRQEIHVEDADDFLYPTGWVVSGGGGGVTSDWPPSTEGDDSYGFMHLTLSKNSITVRNVDHLGNDTHVAVVQQRKRSERANAGHQRDNVIGKPWKDVKAARGRPHSASAPLPGDGGGGVDGAARAVLNWLGFAVFATWVLWLVLCKTSTARVSVMDGGAFPRAVRTFHKN
ncbi:unnamed protein product [Prorocentrum cordatum]|uniref:Calcineurin-like phosphoesterase domain-containing protein n=1 Tax=Prorocentrum cordatum TaxID=2364126 RepID=A0ABN9XD22_9DINO|nr:unnamed protein product [Polarella glacialis]